MLTRRLLLTSLLTLPLVRPTHAGTQRWVLDVANPLNRSHLAAKGLLGRWQVLPGLDAANVFYDLVTRQRATITGYTEPPSATSGLAAVTTRKGGYGEVRSKAGDYATLGDLTRYSFTDGAGVDRPFSFMCWYKTAAFTTPQGLMGKFSPGAASEYRLFLDTGGPWLVMELFTGPTDAIFIGRYCNFTAAIAPGWMHVTATYTGSETSAGVALYLNAVQVDIGNYAAGTYTGMSNTATALALGAMAPGINSIVGQADDFRFYNYALPARTVRALYLDSLLGSPGSLNWLSPEPTAVVSAPVAPTRGWRSVY